MAKQGDNIYRRKDGRWEGRYIKGYKPDGKPKYGYVYGKTYDEAYSKLEAKKKKYQRPENAVGFTGMFSDYCIRWLDTTARERGIKQSTYGSYYRDISNHIIPALGGKLPHLLCEADIDGFRDTLRKKKLADLTVIRIMKLLYAILDRARTDGIIVADLRKKVKMPHKRKKQIVVLSRADQGAFERVCEWDKFGLLGLLALYSGMRVGEISALDWPNVDYEHGGVWVRETAQRISNYDFYDEAEANTMLLLGVPKTETSDRFIALPPFLMAHLAKAESAADCEFVISCKGHIAEPRVLQYRFGRLLAKAGVKKIGIHCCRHTYATRNLEEGTDIQTLSEQMGHANPKITLEIYGSAMLDNKKVAAARLENVHCPAVAV